MTLSGRNRPVSTSLRTWTSVRSPSLTWTLSTRMSSWAVQRGWSSHLSLTGQLLQYHANLTDRFYANVKLIFCLRLLFTLVKLATNVVHEFYIVLDLITPHLIKYHSNLIKKIFFFNISLHQYTFRTG